MAEFSVREVGPDDLSAAAAAIAAAWLELQIFHQGLGLTFPIESDSADKWQASFQRTLGRFSFLWVGEQAGAVRAFLLARVKQGPAFLGAKQVGEISDLYVDESLRGVGAGKLLVDEAMRKFAELGVHSVEVQVQAGNDGGLDFWHKQGFATDLTLVRKVLR